jgi:ribosomal-protein-alanine N-acetyltransferase
MSDLETERLQLRRFRQADLRAIFAWASDPQVTRYAFWEHHRSLADTQWFIDFCAREYAEKGIGPWAVCLKSSGELIGQCSFGVIDPPNFRVELAYFFSPRHWGHGFATEALSAVIGFGFGTIGLHRMEARCMTGNLASERVMQKLGMKYEGILRRHTVAKGQAHDLKVYSILKNEWADRLGS